MRLFLKIYRDKKREFRWRLVAANGQILADSGEGYKRRAGMDKAICLVLGFNWFSGFSIGQALTLSRTDIMLEDEA